MDKPALPRISIQFEPGVLELVELFRRFGKELVAFGDGVDKLRQEYPSLFRDTKDTDQRTEYTTDTDQ